MTEKEILKKLEVFIYSTYGTLTVKDVQGILNLIQRKDRQIEKLKNKNKDLLRKLRNRVKEVKKLIKYSLYKKEFSKLNRMLEQKNRQIDLMADTILEDTLKLDTCWCNGCSKTIECPYKNPNECIVQYFANQAKEVRK